MGHVGLFIFLVQLFERPQLLALLDEGLDHRDTGEAFLGKIRQPGIGLLPGIPLDRQPLANDGGRGQQESHGDQRKQGQNGVHAPHIAQRHDAQHHRVKQHHNAPAEAFLHGVQVVGKQAHQIADLIDLVIFPAQLLGVGEHAVAHILLQPNGAAKEADTPQKAADDDKNNDFHHGQADKIQHKVHGKGVLHAIDDHKAIIHTVDHHAIKGRDLQLQVIHHQKGGQACDQPV